MQAQSIQGTVKSAGGEALEAVIISILNTGRSEVTDAQGNYRFTEVPAGTYELRVNSLGYATRLVTAKVTAQALPPCILL